MPALLMVHIAASKLWGNINNYALFSTTTHMFTHIQTHTPTWSDWPSFSPLWVCSGLEQTLTNNFQKGLLPSLLSFPFCHPPLHPSLGFFSVGSVHPLICLPAPHFVHSGRALNTPHPTLELLFSTNVSDERGSGCEGLIPTPFSPFPHYFFSI